MGLARRNRKAEACTLFAQPSGNENKAKHNKKHVTYKKGLALGRVREALARPECPQRASKSKSRSARDSHRRDRRPRRKRETEERPSTLVGRARYRPQSAVLSPNPPPATGPPSRQSRELKVGVQLAFVWIYQILFLALFSLPCGYQCILTPFSVLFEHQMALQYPILVFLMPHRPWNSRFLVSSIAFCSIL